MSLTALATIFKSHLLSLSSSSDLNALEDLLILKSKNFSYSARYYRIHKIPLPPYSLLINLPIFLPAILSQKKLHCTYSESSSRFR